MDTNGKDKSRGSGFRFSRSTHFNPYTATFLCSASAGQPDFDKLPEPLARSLVHSDHVDLSGACAGSDREFGGGALGEYKLAVEWRLSVPDTESMDPRSLTFSQAQGYKDLPSPLALEELSSDARREL